MSDSIRIDKWLWAVRLFKTRTLAADACRAGHIRIDGEIIKPAREIRPGITVTARTGDVTRTVRVLALLDSRVGAARVPDFLEDLTPEAEYARARARALENRAFRPAGAGRPTKRDRRQMEAWLDLPPPPPEP